MGIAVSLILIAVGLILALAVNDNGTHAVDPNTAGWILFIVGLLALILDVLLWESWGPGYMRRRRATYVDGGYPAAPAPRRRVVQEDVVEDAGPPGPPGPPPP